MDTCRHQPGPTAPRDADRASHVCPHTHSMFTTPAETEPQMPRGLPRPLFMGWPVPYTSEVNPSAVAQGMFSPAISCISTDRQRETQRLNRCLACGESLNDDTHVIAFYHPEDGRALDSGALHERCARLAQRWCPALAPGNEQDFRARRLTQRAWQEVRRDVMRNGIARKGTPWAG